MNILNLDQQIRAVNIIKQFLEDGNIDDYLDEIATGFLEKVGVD